MFYISWSYRSLSFPFVYKIISAADPNSEMEYRKQELQEESKEEVQGQKKQKQHPRCFCFHCPSYPDGMEVESLRYPSCIEVVSIWFPSVIQGTQHPAPGT